MLCDYVLEIYPYLRPYGQILKPGADGIRIKRDPRLEMHQGKPGQSTLIEVTDSANWAEGETASDGQETSEPRP